MGRNVRSMEKYFPKFCVYTYIYMVYTHIKINTDKHIYN